MALALLAASTAQEARAGAGLSQERERELRILAAESGLDVSGVADEEELLARIANHPPTMRALRVSAQSPQRRARARDGLTLAVPLACLCAPGLRRRG